MSARPRLSDLQKRISEKSKTGSRKSAETYELEANPEHGLKGDFVKISVTVPPALYDKILTEQSRRKKEGPKRRRAGEKTEPHGLSAIIREALVEYFTRKG